MDEIEGGVLARIPPGVLQLKLTRSTIRMQHSTTWKIDKTNPVHDLLIGLQGRGTYRIEDKIVTLEPGEALIIPKRIRFEGWNEGPAPYLGIAQHFTITAYGGADLIEQMHFRRKVKLRRWEMLEPIVWHYRQSAPPNSVTLQQQHLFMYLLINVLEDAFDSWRMEAASQMKGADAIDLAVMKAAGTISASPLETDIAERAIEEAAYNPDYFQREFQKRVGRTPRKYQELCRMEKAMHLLETGLSVAQTAESVGYSDPYYFSRMFKRMIGMSPREHLRRIRLSRDGNLLELDEDEQEQILADAIRLP